jgi:hypothetical protein
MERTNAMVERTQAIMAAAKAKREQKDLEMLDTKSGAQRFLREQDAKLLDTIMDQLAAAYNRDIMTGYKFDDNIEKMVAIVSNLQFAKREVRELLEPSSDKDLDLYAIFDRDLRDMVTGSYGSLPYLREPTVITMADGETKVLDQDVCMRAGQGSKADVATLNVAINIIASKLGLYADYEATETQEEVAWNNAVERLTRSKQLQLLQGELSK